MHDAAEKWDRKYEKDVAHHRIEKGKFVPVNRPCDWCGQSVDVGYIHETCGKQEQKAWLEILD